MDVHNTIKDGSVDTVLACRILHFLRPEILREGLKQIHKWLAPGGKLFVVTETPFVKHLQEAFYPIYL